MFDGNSPCFSCIIFRLSPDLTWLCDLRVIWPCESVDYCTWPKSHDTLIIIAPDQKSTPPDMLATCLKEEVLRFYLPCMTKSWEGQMAVWLIGPYLEPPVINLVDNRCAESGDTTLNFAHNFLWPFDWRVTSFVVNCLPVVVICHKFPGKREITFFICFVTSIDHLIKLFVNVEGGDPLSKAISIMAINLVEVKIYWLLFATKIRATT